MVILGFRYLGGLHNFLGSQMKLMNWSIYTTLIGQRGCFWGKLGGFLEGQPKGNNQNEAKKKNN